MEGPGEASQVCSQCSQEVAVSNFAQHESHCRKFLCSNPDRDEPVAQDQGPTDTLNQLRVPLEAQEGSLELRSRTEHFSPLPQEDASDHDDDDQSPAVKVNAQRYTKEACWYCMKSCPSDGLNERKEDETVSAPSTGKHVGYQQDPRPHFGVSRSSRSTAVPLWGNEGPVGGDREIEGTERTSPCPHCHLALSAETLQWHEAKCRLFGGVKNSVAK